VLERRAFDLDRILDIEPEFLAVDNHDHDHHDGHDHHHDHGHGLKHYHDEDMQSISARLDGDLDPNKFMPWINQLTQTLGPKILRCKGIISLRGDPKRFVFQGVHMMLDGEPQRDWKPGEKRESKAVFIGRELDEEQIRKGFLACAA
jgi:G3E family GTPase